MTAVPKTRLTPEQYLAIERKAAFKSEYYNGEMFAMAGASYPHNRAKDNLAHLLNASFWGGPCFAITSDQRVKVSRTGLYTYPDIVIVCGKPEFEDAVGDTLLNPQIVIAVLADSTEKYDRGKRFRHYRYIESLREYVLVAQDEPVIERFVRQPDGSFAQTFVEGLDREFTFATVPVRVRLTDVYAGVTFPAEGPTP